ncbi:MAG: proton-conducting transporter membrane subunit [Candidatus Melainabacteria bacterium]|nr:proton-conducting transporter membrane subunit [Candidatus Melainabacteria bacterium]
MLISQNLFRINALSLVMSCLVIIVGLVVTAYSLKYMRGDTEYKGFFIRLFILVASLICMFNVDNLLLFATLWAFSNLILVMMIVHKAFWKQALESGLVATRNFSVGMISLLLFIGLSFSLTKTFSISETLVSFTNIDPVFQCALLALLIITAMTQSAQLPFHGWLMSSINTPTPVSALMHAGLVNGGGYLLVKFAMALGTQSASLPLIFIIGSVSAFAAMLWLFVKSSVKGVLVSSTISQMGFMFMQIGLGLYPAAISHLCMHGFFKAFHFLSAGSAFSELKILKLALNRDMKQVSVGINFLISLSIASVALYLLSGASHISINFEDSSFILLIFIAMALTELSFNIIKEAQKTINLYLTFFLALLSSSVVAIIYGSFLHFFEQLLAASVVSETYRLTALHYFVSSVFITLWALMHFKKDLLALLPMNLRLPLYAFLMNSSRAKASTYTSSRGDYAYLKETNHLYH